MHRITLTIASHHALVGSIPVPPLGVDVDFRLGNDTSSERICISPLWHTMFCGWQPPSWTRIRHLYRNYISLCVYSFSYPAPRGLATLKPLPSKSRIRRLVTLQKFHVLSIQIREILPPGSSCTLLLRLSCYFGCLHSPPIIVTSLKQTCIKYYWRINRTSIRITLYHLIHCGLVELFCRRRSN